MNEAPNVSRKANARANASGDEGTGSASKTPARRRFELDADVLEAGVDKKAKASLVEPFVEPFVETFGCFASADVETRDARDAQGASRRARSRGETRGEG